jgi:hypothetical protein
MPGEMSLPHHGLLCVDELPAYHTSSALYPVIEHLQRWLAWHRRSGVSGRGTGLHPGTRAVPAGGGKPTALPSLMGDLAIL